MKFRSGIEISVRDRKSNCSVSASCNATDTRAGQLAAFDARHPAHARVEEPIRCAKDTGLDHFPSRSFAINTAWLAVDMIAVDMIAVDMIAWTQHLLLHGDLAKVEP
jgi:hypothetical protein